MSKIIVLVPFIAALGARIAGGADDPAGHAAVAHTITILDSDVIHPSTLTMHSGDVLEFNNYSAQTMMLVFTEPRDPAANVRCRVVDASAAWAAAWQLNDSSSGPRLSAIVPPGRSASACSLTPGHYAFDMRPVPRDVRAPEAMPGTTGTIAVQ